MTELRPRQRTTPSTDCRGQSRRARSILAVPAYVAAALLRAFDTTLAGLCDAVPYASTATVALGYRRDQIRHPMRGSGFVVPRVERMPAAGRDVGHVEVARPRARTDMC